MEMKQPILNKVCTLYIDNWYSSPSLFLKLLKYDTNAFGTVKKNGKNMPKLLASLKLEKREVKIVSCRGIMTSKWKDKKDVYILITKHSNADFVDTGKKRKTKDGIRIFEDILCYRLQ
ncbi:piggyBac transposable element-derived protein 4 [Nephila pilipes]|uniref:PiggyBac transposable element-derived protein 4 n=1 Tax=Nephila pilipes TaxID=299642 RepID=A0A8X6TME4_NEPPI|nr:piggyBac transposable element-derived protein 4 [Nephila pilipes]